MDENQVRWRIFLRRLALAGGIVLLCSACADSARRAEADAPRLREVTAEEAALLAAMRREGAALVTDGCVFAKGVSTRQVGLEESRAFAKLSLERIKPLAEGNGIRITSAVSPLVCGSHGHLGTWAVGAAVDSDASNQTLPVADIGMPAEKALLYQHLLATLVSSYASFPLKKDCVWCWKHRANSPPKIFFSPAQATELQALLGSRYVLIDGTGGQIETKARLGLRNAGAAVVSIIALFAGATPHGIGGRSDLPQYIHGVVDLQSRLIAWRFKLMGVELRSYPGGTEDAFRNKYFPFLGVPNLSCKISDECRESVPWSEAY